MSTTPMTFFLFIILFITIFLALVSSQVLPSYSGFQGKWHLLQASIGISAMHMQLLYNNKLIIFDRTDFGPSNISLIGGHCRFDPNDTVLTTDCTAHSILYNVETNTFQPLMVQTDTWCSSGSVLPNGTLVQTGGFNDGDRHIRTFSPCIDNTYCDWMEFPNYLFERRWYSTNHILPDGRIIIIGGRRQPNYEFYPQNGIFSLKFLDDTTDDNENNLYPFVHLLPDGNLYIFANTRSISLNYIKNIVVKEYPPIPDGNPHNYPSSGSSILMPIDDRKFDIKAEIMICGGAPQGSFSNASIGTYMQALRTCWRITVTDINPQWIMEEMPIPRVMGDMLLLPTSDIIILNGAMSGTAGWELGRDPVLTPIIYRPYEVTERQFIAMSPAIKPRMYHSSATLLLDGRVLVGGSNPHMTYNFTSVNYPTELSLEAFSPPYLSAEYDAVRPNILSMKKNLGYKELFLVTFKVRQYFSISELSFRLIAPSFTTHSFSMNQRMVVLKLISVKRVTLDAYSAFALGPTVPEIAPPGYYMLFVVHAGIPSSGAWLKVG